MTHFFKSSHTTIAVTRKGTNQTESSETKIVMKSDGLRQYGAPHDKSGGEP